ncbi:MAG: OmpA family protein [Candidatus Adiutrix sp.]|jgi:OOP family OmpA-OmpF porin|nr:OmpA family protein [Candidatus Adiutrix sp.]
MRLIFISAFFLIFAAAPAPAEVLVQVMSVQEAAMAEKEAARLFSQGVPALSRTEESADGQTRHRVYVGPFETEADAAAAAAALKKNGTIKEFLVKNVQPEQAAEPGSDQPRLGTEIPDTPVLSGGESIAGLPAAPADLPVAETPTYGEPVSPEQARNLTGLTGVSQPGDSGIAGPGAAGGPPTYGQTEAAPAAAPGLPPGLSPGDDLPGLAPTAPSAGDGSQPAARGSLASFEFLVDLSSSMRRPGVCQGLTKEEAVTRLVRKMNRRIPGHPYQAAFRVFGYKPVLTRDDFTTLYFGPAQYSRDGFENSISRLAAANSITPLSAGLTGAEADLQGLPGPKAVLTFSDFEESGGSGQPLQTVENARRHDGPVLVWHSFYVTRQIEAERLAKNLARTGGGQAWNICSLLASDQAFENMMLTIFGPGDDLCRNAPPGAEVDERGCWIAAYSQFFDFGQAVVKAEFRPRLVEAARLIREQVAQGDQVVIAGFTDNVGSQEFNLDLGRRRAQAVADILVNEGVPAGKLSVTSYGKDRPVADNGTEEGRARSRRVEFHVGAAPQAR